jgi:hypothetical protein
MIATSSGGGQGPYPVALVAAVLPPAPNAFYRSTLGIGAKGVVRERLVSSAAGTFTVTATVGARSLRDLRKLSCPKTKSKRTCPPERVTPYGSAAASTTAAGALTVVVTPDRAVRVAIAKHRRLALKLTITIAFAPSAGPAPVSQTVTATVTTG